MATPSQIDEQVKLEREQIRKGIDILRDNTQNLESKSYSSATIYGVTSIRDLLPLVIEQIETRKDMLKRCLLYTSPSPRDLSTSRMPSSA